MRLRGAYLLVVAAVAVVALTFAGSAAAVTPDPACGTTLIASFTLTADINCTGSGASALYIGQAGITVNLNGHTITGDTGQDVIDNSTAYDGLTVENGTIMVAGAGIAVDNSNGGTGLVVSNLTLTGDGSGGSVGVDTRGSSGSPLTGSTVTGSTISDFNLGVVLHYTAGSVVKGNTITLDNNYTGIDSENSTGDMITGNTITNTTAQQGSGIYLYRTAGTVISGNTVTRTYEGVYDGGSSAGLMVTGNVFGGNYKPNNGNTIGILLSGGGSGDVISGNYVRNSEIYGVHDLGSFDNTYTNNVFNANDDACGANLYVNPNGAGPVTVVNNYSNSATCIGYSILNAYNATVPGGPYTLVSGNTALLNGTGFWLQNNVGATISNNIAGVINYGNNYGFVFWSPERNTISNNSATGNGKDGFDFNNVVAPYAPLAVTNNSATYNGVYGFWGENPVAGRGNTGSSTNGTADCHLVAGCS